MKNILLAALLFFGLIGTGFSQTKDLNNFSSLSVCGSIKITLKKGKNPQASINMIKGDIDDLILEVDGGELTVEFRKKKMGNWGNNNRKAEIELTYTKLEGIEACAGASVKTSDELDAASFEAEASSGASIKIGLLADEVDVDISSGASITIAGKGGELDVEVSSGASFYGAEFAAEEVDVEVSSGASANVWATKALDAEASSGGSVRYKGDPKEMDLDSGKYSGGSIRKI